MEKNSSSTRRCGLLLGDGGNINSKKMRFSGLRRNSSKVRLRGLGNKKQQEVANFGVGKTTAAGDGGGAG